MLRKSMRRVQVQLATAQNESASLKAQWGAYVERHRQREMGLDTTELENAKRFRVDLNEQLATKQAELLKLRMKSSERSDFLKALTKIVACRMLGEDGFGLFKPESDTQPFQLSVGGEAYQVLEVLLGDITTLLDSAMSHASLHPGLVVHDCPREADMSERLYREFLLLVREAEAQLKNRNAIPFQYVVTTTSAPPESLRDNPFLILELRPGNENDFLFKRKLSLGLPGI